MNAEPPESETSEAPDTSTLIAERRAKLERLREAGLEPFPAGYAGREPIAAVRGPTRVSPMVRRPSRLTSSPAA